MKEKDIRDDEIRVIGEDDKAKFNGWKWLLLLLAGIVIGLVVWALLPQKHEDPKEDPEQGVFEPGNDSVEQTVVKLPLAKAEDNGKAYIEMIDTTINDIPLRLYMPHQVTMSLHLGAIDRNDTSIIFTAQAADIRADNGGIVGAFVLEGEPKAWGLSKKGFCAIINDTVTVGVAEVGHAASPILHTLLCHHHATPLHQELGHVSPPTPLKPGGLGTALTTRTQRKQCCAMLRHSP